jgi:hypothetical protein
MFFIQKMSERFKPISIISGSFPHETISAPIDYPESGIVYEFDGGDLPPTHLKERVQYSFKCGSVKSLVVDGTTYRFVQGKCKGCQQCGNETCSLTFNLNVKRTMCPCEQQLTKIECNVKIYFLTNNTTNRVDAPNIE